MALYSPWLSHSMATDSLLKMIKNAFYFTLKSHFGHKISKSVSWFFGNIEKWLDQKDQVNLKTYCITIAIHILPNIPRGKGDHTMKITQLIEYKTRNNFLEKSYIKCGGETIPRLFSKKSKLNISLDQYFKVLYSLFLLYTKVRLWKYIETKGRPLVFYMAENLFKKWKKPETGLLTFAST